MSGQLGSRVHLHGHWRTFSGIAGKTKLREYAPEFFLEEEEEEQQEEIQPFQYKARRG